MNINVDDLLRDESTDYTQDDLRLVLTGRTTEERKLPLARMLLASYRRGWAESEAAYQAALAIAGIAFSAPVARA